MLPYAWKSFGIFIATVVAVAFVSTQCRKPRWLLGRLYLWLMNRTHSHLTAWGLQHVSIQKSDAILDIGCGGGRTIQSLALIATEGKVFGIDHSAESVAASRRLNSTLISAGQVDIQTGSVSSLPYPDGMFDVVTAVETHYYWPAPVDDFRQVLRVLKPGGSFVLIAEVYRRNKQDPLYPLIMKVLGGACPTVSQLEEQLANAGFSAVETFKERRKGWLCCVARRARV